MAVVLLSFATNEYFLSQKILSLSGRLMGVDRCIQKTRQELEKTEFYRTHKAILDQERGAGYWLWKPYLILETLNSLRENDTLIYSDSAALFWNNVAPLVNLVKKDSSIALFYNDVSMKHFSKRDVFLALNCDDERYHNAPMTHAGIQVYRKCFESTVFLREVLNYATTDELITDAPNKLGKDNLPGFIDHRHDQAILSLVAHKNGLTFQMDPSQFRTKKALFHIEVGDIFPTEISYRSIIFFHRYRNRQLFRLLFDIFKKLYGSVLSNM